MRGFQIGRGEGFNIVRSEKIGIGKGEKYLIWQKLPLRQIKHTALQDRSLKR